MKNVTIYTDGACSGNPGPGGWGAGLRWRPQSVKRFEALTEPTGETPDPYEKRRLPMANRKRNIQMKFYFYGSAI